MLTRGNWTKMALACWEKAADGDVSAQTFMGIQQIYSLPCLDRAKKPEADRGLARRLVAVVGRAVLETWRFSSRRPRLALSRRCARTALWRGWRSASAKRPWTIGKRDRIPYALETDWLVGAAGFEPLHIESEFAKTLSPGGRTRTCASRIKDARAHFLQRVSGARSTPRSCLMKQI
jgi:hypothetical protein